MNTVPLTQGQIALIDDDDAPSVLAHRWTARRASNGDGWYAVGRPDGRRVRMHRWILGAPLGIDVDHVNHNGLDNQRINLRLVTKSQNMANRRPCRNGSSRFKGVCWASNVARWRADIRVNGVLRYLGVFVDEEQAAAAYDTAALEAWGEYANPNLKEAA